MSQIAVADLRGVSSSEIAVPTPPSLVIHRERLSHAEQTLGVVQRLRGALEGNAPTEELLKDLYGDLVKLRRLCGEENPITTPSVELRVLADSAEGAVNIVHPWYLHSLGDPWEFVKKCKLTPELYNFDAKREPPTVSAVASLEGTVAAIRQGFVNLARAEEVN